MKKIWIIIAVLSITIGSIISISVLSFIKFDISKFSNQYFDEKTYTTNTPFENIDINSMASNIIFMPSTNDECTVIYHESEQIKFNVSVENNTLNIKFIDHRKWYEHIGFFIWFKNNNITVYLPTNEYKNLCLSSVSGNISVPNNFKFSETTLKTTSGKIRFDAAVQGDFQVETTSGDIYVKNITANLLEAYTTSGEIDISDFSTKSANIQSVSGDVSLTNSTVTENIDIETTSGEIDISNLSAKTGAISTTSGDISLTNTIINQNVYIESTSGEVLLREFDSQYIQIETVSGDVEGSLLSDKYFITNTTSGKVNVPNSTFSSQKCYINTTSGDIKLIIKSN